VTKVYSFEMYSKFVIIYLLFTPSKRREEEK